MILSQRVLTATTLLTGMLSAICPASERDADQPNVILIMADDLGYGDLSSQGSAMIRTPAIDRLGTEGTRFTQFYVAQAVCTASRAALMTGCYPNRLGMHGAYNHTSRGGIADSEWLLSEMFAEQGYAVAGMGKWHLGTRPKFHPMNHGFDDWLGIPYSNDNTKYHPVLSDSMPPLPFYDKRDIIELDPDQAHFTKRLTQRAVQFIEANQEKPFFLYVPHIMPHVPIFASEDFRGRSRAGLYGDVIEELDWSVAEILKAVQRCGLDENTLIMFISDNGPFLSYGEHAGSAAPLREGKLTVFEGGVRVPCLIRWPGRITAGRVSSQPWMSIDVLPTFVELISGVSPDLPVDGRSALSLLLGRPAAQPPHDVLFFYSGTQLHAVRQGAWKLHFPHPYLTVAAEPGVNGKPSNWGRLAPQSITQSGVEGIASRHGYRIEQLPLSLYNLNSDPGESRNLAAQNPEVVANLSRLADLARQDLGDSLTGVAGSGLREPGFDPPGADE
jgi:arylsulfatase